MRDQKRDEGVMKHMVWLPEKERKRLQRYCCVIDFCFPIHKIGYDFVRSDYTDQKDIDAQRDRRQVLEKLGYQIIWIDVRDFIDVGKKIELRIKLADLCGHHIDIDTSKEMLDKERALDVVFMKIITPFKENIIRQQEIVIELKDIQERLDFIKNRKRVDKLHLELNQLEMKCNGIFDSYHPD